MHQPSAAPRFSLPLLSALLSLPTVGSAQQWLTAPREISSQPGERVLATGDFDGDGRVDLVVTQLSVQSHTAAWWIAFGSASGDFVPGPVQGVLPTGFQGDSWVLAGDVTGDGAPDVLMSYSNTFGPPGSGFVCYRNLGGGTFAAPLHTPGGVPWLQNSSALGDWNGDGVLELVSITIDSSATGHEVRRWTWQAGTFVGNTALALPAYANQITVGDVTGDGLADTLVGCANDNRVWVIPTLAGGGFGAVTTLFVGALPMIAGPVPTCGDVDGDGDQDVVVAWPTYLTGANVAVLTNNGGVLSIGATQFFPVQPSGYWQGRAWIADADGDGDGDVYLGHDALCMLENVGGTTFQARSVVRLEPYTGSISNGHEGAGLRDLDGDQHPDFVGAHAIAFGTGRFEVDALPDQLSSYRYTVDDDGDGDLDILDERGARYENLGSDAWLPHASRFPPTALPFHFTVALAIGDFTGDGRVDQLVVYVQNLSFPLVQILGTHLLEGRADGSLFDRGLAGPSGALVGDLEAFALTHRDLDGDGDLDVATTDGYWENNGTGLFPTFHAAWTGRPRQLADVNGDGRIDVLTEIVAFTTTEHRLFLAQPAGGFVGQLLASGPIAQVLPIGMLADLDDDGDLDFVVGSTSSPALLLRENQAGVFAPPITLPSRSHAFERLLVDDFDRDGKTDLAAASGSSWGDPALVWRRIGPGLTYAPPRGFVTSSPMLGQAADLDGDGDPDLHGSDGMLRSGRWAGPGAGRHSQYGSSVAGSSGAAPLLGVRGPVRSAGAIELRLRRAPANSFAALDFGSAPANVPNVPFPNLTLRVVPQILLVLATPGTAGVPASGAADLPVTTPPGLLGQKFYLQAFTLDGNSFGASNGLELVFGL